MKFRIMLSTFLFAGTALAGSNVYTGKITLNKTIKTHEGDQSLDDFKNIKLGIKLGLAKIGDEWVARILEINRDGDFDNLSSCVGESRHESCKPKVRVMMVTRGDDTKELITISFGTGDDEVAETMTISGTFKGSGKNSKFIGTGEIFDMNYDQGSFLHAVSFELTQVNE